MNGQVSSHNREMGQAMKIKKVLAVKAEFFEMGNRMGAVGGRVYKSTSC